jgi:hypothetical protein
VAYQRAAPTHAGHLARAAAGAGVASAGEASAARESRSSHGIGIGNLGISSLQGALGARVAGGLPERPPPPTQDPKGGAGATPRHTALRRGEGDRRPTRRDAPTPYK